MPIETPTHSSCPRCHEILECRADSIAQCQCSKVRLTDAERGYIRQQYQGCLCVPCLLRLSLEYHAMLEKIL